MHPTHGTTSNPVLARAAVLALALALGLGAAVPAAAAGPRADVERPTWAVPLTNLGDLLARLFGDGGPARLIGHGESDGGPDMDPNGLNTGGDDGPGLGASGDDGAGLDPDGPGAEGDGGPDMDPNG